MKLPRIMIAAPKSGSGKTLLTCALLGALKKKNTKVCSFKCGPDYIDPMFHRTVLKVPSENLDTWFTGEEETREQFVVCARRYGAELAVMEGVMGFYDGLGGTCEEGSAAHLAAVTGTPVILTVDVHGMGRSMVPLIYGFLSYDTQGLIRGIILNRISKTFYETMKPLLEEMLAKFSDRPYQPKLLGYFPDRKDLKLESRHLGLQLPEEITGLENQLDLAAAQLMDTVDLQLLLEVAESAEEIYLNSMAMQMLSVPKIPAAMNVETGAEPANKTESATENVSKEAPLLAVARDEAFCFYYEANLRELEKCGARICYFSPLHDAKLPEGTCGILLGGGYPELWAEDLSKNVSMREDIRRSLEAGLPSLAECGGFMYLHETLTDQEGKSWPMAGVLPGGVSYRGKLVRFGYVEVEENSSVFLPEGSRIRGHEFHYYDSTDNGACCRAVKPVSGRSWQCIHEEENHFWGFPHLYYPSAPEFAAHFVEAMVTGAQAGGRLGVNSNSQ